MEPFRCPRLDTHQPPTHLHTSSPTHPHTNPPFSNSNQTSGLRLQIFKKKIQLPGLSSSHLSLTKTTRHLSFQLSADSSTLTSHSSASSEYSHSRWSLLASTCFEFDTCLLTPIHRQQKSQQVTPAVSRPVALNTTETLTKHIAATLFQDSEHPSTHPQPYAAEGFVNEPLLLPWHWNPCFPKPLWTEDKGYEN